MASNGRIESARRRVLSLKKTLALASAGVFAISVGVARATDSHATRGTGTQVRSFDDGEWDGDDDGSIGPVQGTPQVQTGVS